MNSIAQKVKFKALKVKAQEKITAVADGLGLSAAGTAVLSVYRTNGKLIKIIHARAMQPEEKFFYQRKLDQTLAH